MTSRNTVGAMAFLIPLAVGLMAGGWWFALVPLIEEELTASRSVWSIAFTGGTLGLVAGPLVDWKGPRLLMVSGGLVAAVGLLIVSTASNLPVLLTGGFITSAGLALAGSIVIQVLVVDWFIQYRGTFLGLALLGAGLGGWLGRNFLPILAESTGWRITEGLLALAGAGVAVVAFTLIHNYPAPAEADAPDKARVTGRRSPRQERMIPAGQYFKSPGLWRAFIFLALASAAVSWIKWDLDVAASATIYDRIGGFSSNNFLSLGIVAGGFGWSAAADFWPRNRLFWQSATGVVVSMMLLNLPFISPVLGGLEVVGLHFLVFGAGVCLGGLSALIMLTFIDYMGVQFLGTLSLGFAFLAGVVSTPGPIVAGSLFDAFGSSASSLVFLPLLVPAVLLAARAPYPLLELEQPVPLS
ncbi:MAG: MFS transporter [SAR202 cluster bacterium]|nr:MFS transporter [SAR202 cluster bacterium]